MKNLIAVTILLFHIGSIASEDKSPEITFSEVQTLVKRIRLKISDDVDKTKIETKTWIGRDLVLSLPYRVHQLNDTLKCFLFAAEGFEPSYDYIKQIIKKKIYGADNIDFCETSTNNNRQVVSMVDLTTGEKLAIKKERAARGLHENIAYDEEDEIYFKDLAQSQASFTSFRQLFNSGDIAEGQFVLDGQYKTTIGKMNITFVYDVSTINEDLKCYSMQRTSIQNSKALRVIKKTPPSEKYCTTTLHN